MAKIFQPKIIIGSVLGIITSALGLIAIFFPSLLNLETKKIDSFSLYIVSDNDIKKLFNFLKDHEDKIVNLEVSYDEGLLLTHNTEREDDATAENFYKRIVYPIEAGASGEGAAIFGENNLFHVTSSFKLGPFEQTLVREKGGFGFWVRHPETTLEKELDFMFQVAVRHSSRGNTLFFWGNNEKFNPDDGKRTAGSMVLRGTFYVSPLAKADAYGNDSAFMIYNFYYEKCWQYGTDTCYSPDVFDLEPLNRKDLQLKKY